MSKLGFVEEDLFRFFSQDNLHFWYGRTLAEDQLPASAGGYGEYEWYLIVPSNLFRLEKQKYYLHIFCWKYFWVHNYSCFLILFVIMEREKIAFGQTLPKINEN